ncbi:MAG: glycoside hydrolase family 26 protein [Bacteroidales bacterium]|nr:glycoside hydrolase family 26 protein [Bacteroidales bacterium]
MNIFFASVFLLSGSGCGSGSVKDELTSDLRSCAKSGEIMFGHQDDLLYGHNWKISDSETAFLKSDVYDVCGSYPSVLGLDVSGIELGSKNNIDGNSFEKMRLAAIVQYERGGVVTLSWHVPNPLTGGDSWDVSSDKVVESVLPGGSEHDTMMFWLSRLADWIGSLKDENGKPVPVIFRPWHENYGGWFWWGASNCTADQYVALWKMTHDYLAGKRKLGGRMLWAFSPNSPFDSVKYLERYPGDKYVDILGLDCYRYDDGYVSEMKKCLDTVSALGKSKGKIIAVTETGYEGVPDADWWTGAFYPAISDYPVAYVLVWRNAWDRPGHFFAPYPGAASENDFKVFAEKSKIKLIRK